MEIREYLDRSGRSPFAAWFDELDAKAAAKVATSITRLGLGNISNVKGLGGGVFEARIDSGPGYRIYFGKDNQTVVILLGGGTKRRQQDEIAAASARWIDHKLRKKGKT